MNKLKNNIVDRMGAPITLDDLGNSIIELFNIQFKEKNIKNKVIHMSWDVKYSEQVSCSHNAPIGKETNWGGQKDVPRYYPGWAGRLWVVFKKRNEDWEGNLFKYVHIHPGTGGYGNYRNPNYTAITPSKEYPLSWDLKIFEDDWAAMKVHNNLIGAEFPKKHEFIYTCEDPDEEI